MRRSGPTRSSRPRWMDLSERFAARSAGVLKRLTGPFGLRVVAPLILGLSACGSPGGDGPDASEVSQFREGAPITGRVVENSTACEVDAVCYLRIEFSDTTIVGVYGTGERPAPPCEIPIEASDAAFQVEVGRLINIVISSCAGEGYYVERVIRDAARP